MGINEPRAAFFPGPPHFFFISHGGGPRPEMLERTTLLAEHHPRRGEKALRAQSASEGYLDSRRPMANSLARASGSYSPDLGAVRKAGEKALRARSASEGYLDSRRAMANSLARPSGSYSPDLGAVRKAAEDRLKRGLQPRSSWCRGPGFFCDWPAFFAQKRVAGASFPPDWQLNRENPNWTIKIAVHPS